MPAHFQSRLIFAGIGIFLLAGAYYAFFGTPSSLIPTFGACPADARQCPDGTYVGRVGSKCEFAECPSTDAVPAGTMPKAEDASGNFKQTITASGVSITPLSLVEDSRCAIGVQCIQAGTVRIKATVKNLSGSTNATLTLGSPFVLGDDTVVLIGVYPGNTPGKKIADGDYLFTFHVISR